MRNILLITILSIQIGCSFLGIQKNYSNDKELVLLASAGLSTDSINEGLPSGSGEASPTGTSIISSDGKFSINIPEGALNEEVTFTITKYVPPTNALPGNFIPTIDIYQVTPPYRFNKPVTVNMVVDESLINAYNLDKTKSTAFSISSTSPEDDVNRFPSWSAHESKVNGSKLTFTTKTFSIFGAGTPPPGNHAPVIYGAYYYFKPDCSYLPYRLRTEVADPDGDIITVYLVTGPANSGTNSISMTREGSTNWYNANVPYEAMAATGIKMQVIAVDSNGLNTAVPNSNVFTYPVDSGNANFIANYNRDVDGDGLLCAWERDNGRSDTNSGDVAGATDSDADGIPNGSDHTPNGETNPYIDSLTINPNLVTMDVSEKISFGVSASMGGAFRFVNASFSTTGNSQNGSSVGSINNGIFVGNHPGIAGVFASVDSLTATATAKVRDTVGPNNITDLVAIAISNTQIRLQWSAPGDDGFYGKASSYQVYRSTSVISNNANCNGSLVFHGLIPKNANLQERLDINGLTPNTNYYFCIRAFDDSGNLNSWNGTVSATTHPVPDLSSPGNITTATATTISYDQIQLNWTSVGDDGFLGSATAYEIRRSTSPINNDTQCDSAVNLINNVPILPSGNALTFVVSGLSDFTIHYFCIRAFDEVNNRSSWNGILSATTLRANGAPFVSLVATSLVDIGESATLNATASNDPDAATCFANPSNYNYNWVLAQKPISSTRTSVDITNANTLIAGFSPDVPGEYIFQFSFTDDPGSCAGVGKITTVAIPLNARQPIFGHGLTPLNLAVNVTTFAGGAPGHVDQWGTNARFTGPMGIATNGKDLFLADGTSFRTVAISTGDTNTRAGSPGNISFVPSTDGIGLSASFQFLRGVTSDSQYVYVCDLHLIRKIQIGTWDVTTIAGSDYNPMGDGGYVDGIGINSKLNGPFGITKLGQYLYIADSGNRRIRRLNTLTNEVTTFAGSGGNTPVDGIGINASFGNLSYLTNDGINIYMMEWGLIRKINPITGEVTTIAGISNDFTQIDGIGSNARVGIPGGITTDGIFLYFLDSNYLRKLRLSNNEVTTIGGSNTSGIVNGFGFNARFSGGTGLTNDGKSLFLTNFISDQLYVIRKVD